MSGYTTQNGNVVRDPIVCPDCGLLLAEWINGMAVMRHDGRVAVVLEVPCHRRARRGEPACPGVWRHPKSALLAVGA